MHPRLMDLLACPMCAGSPFRLSIEQGGLDAIDYGVLTCSRCGADFPIVNDIPRCYPHSMSDFGRQRGSDKDIRLDDGTLAQRATYNYWWQVMHTTHETYQESNSGLLLDTLSVTPDDFIGATILDAGCGNGRFTQVLRSMSAELVVAMDLGQGVEIAKEYQGDGPNVAYVQGSILNPPFKKGVFDWIFSWGVIHHTPYARQGFKQLSQIVGEGNHLGIYVYQLHPILTSENWSLMLLSLLRQLVVIKPLRALCSRMSISSTIRFFKPLWFIEKFFGFGFLGCHDESWPEKFDKRRYFRVVIDRFQSRFASEHTHEEVVRWFIQEGFQDLKISAHPQIGISAKKGRHESEPVRMTYYTLCSKSRSTRLNDAV